MPLDKLAQAPVSKATGLWDSRTMKKETQPLNLSKISEKKLWALVGGGYLARRMGALPGMEPNEFWALTAMGENVWHLV